MDTRIRELRRALGMTQQELADKLGIGRTIISNYEIGRSSMSDAVLRLIVTTFGVSEIWLRTGEGDMFAAEDSIEQLRLLICAAVEQAIPLLRRILTEQDAENREAAPSTAAAEKKTRER